MWLPYFLYMMDIKKYIAEQFLGNTYHFKCDCLMALDITGVVLDYSLTEHEIILHISLIDEEEKIVKLGLNHPNLTIEEVI